MASVRGGAAMTRRKGEIERGGFWLAAHTTSRSPRTGPLGGGGASRGLAFR
jgi:hypothetical protein